MAAYRFSVQTIFFLIGIFFLHSPEINCLEKTLRKIIRSQSKMVQQPFSLTKESGNNSVVSIPISLNKSPGNTLRYLRRKSSSTILSPTISRTQTIYSKSSTSNKGNQIFSDFRNIRATAKISDTKPGNTIILSNGQDRNHLPNYRIIQANVNYFPAPSELNTASPRSIASSYDTSNVNESRVPIIKSIFIADLNSSKSIISYAYDNDVNEKARVDYLIEDYNPNINIFGANLTTNYFSCATLFQQTADINTQLKYDEFNIEPIMTAQTPFWNKLFDSRYEALMRNPKWPPLKVILIPRTQVDSISKRSFDQHHKNVVSKILNNVVKKLKMYPNFTFTWNEVSHLSQWWKHTTNKNRASFRRLLKEGRIEITYGGWVEPDEGTINLFGLVHQLIEGQEWLKNTLNYTPVVSWLTNSVTHSPTMPYLLASSGISYVILTNLHYMWEKWLAEYQHSDFVWIPNWRHDQQTESLLDKQLNRIGNDRLPTHSILTHFLQFNSAGITACGPKIKVCCDYDFAKSNLIDNNIYAFNVKDKAELLLEQYSKSGTTSRHNVIIAPIGGPDSYESQAAFDYQYNNYQKLAEFININRDLYRATVDFGVPKTYFNSILERYKSFPTLKGDFMNYADISSGSAAYWTGYFTSRPFYKILLRRLQSTLRSTEIMFSFAINFNVFDKSNVTRLLKLLVSARVSTARLMDRHSVSGTLTISALKYAINEISKTMKNCWYIQEYSASYLSLMKDTKNSTSHLYKYVYRDGEIFCNLRNILPNDHMYIFNSMSYERIEVVEFLSKSPNIRILDHKKKEVMIQVNPVWTYDSEHVIKISRTLYKINVVVVIPAMTMELFKIKSTYDAAKNAAVIYCIHCISEGNSENTFFPFNVQPIMKGDIQLESYKLRVIFDEYTGFIKTIIDKEANIEKNINLNYGAFRTSSNNSGMFLFTVNTSSTLYDILKIYKIDAKSNIMLIIVGDITTELISIYGPLLQHKTKIYNLIHNPLAKSLYIESQVDFELAPKNRELEMFLAIQSDISNGNPPQLITDNNSFQYTLRKLNLSRPIESNIYPITSMAYIEDDRNRMTLITDHAQGVTSLQEGQILVLLDRRVLYVDGRGNNEGLADSKKTVHRHIILLEEFKQNNLTHRQNENFLTLPSFAAHYLSNFLDYTLDIFFDNRNIAYINNHAYLPLIKSPFPCDVSVLNFRTIIRKVDDVPNSALLILYKQSFSCDIELLPHPRCDRRLSFSLDKIFHRIRNVFKTRLSGTDTGIAVNLLNLEIFPPLQLISLRIQFYHFR